MEPDLYDSETREYIHVLLKQRIRLRPGVTRTTGPWEYDTDPTRGNGTNEDKQNR